MDMQRILSVFGRLSGLLPEEIVEYRFFCESAAAYMAERTRSGACAWKYRRRLEEAAAALAYYRFVLWRATDSAGKALKIGEIQVFDGDRRLEYAERLCREAFADLKGVLRDDGFVFEGV